MTKTTEPTEILFHIAEPERWRASSDTDWYSPVTLAADGFVHCSYAHQVQRSLDKFFDSHDSVIILEIDPVLLKSELRVEPADGDSYPHIYGEINLDAVVAAEMLTRDEAGALRFNTRRE